jgi:hypothetical protein
MDRLVGRWEPVPLGAKLCGSAHAHGACRFAGAVDGWRHHCNASESAFHMCPYHASGFVAVFERASS